MDDDTKARRRALAAHLDEKKADVEPLTYAPLYGEGAGFDTPGAEWAVLTDAEADLAWDASLDSYIDDAMDLEGTMGALAPYFDREAWKRDARMDGRGHSLNSYDGNEEDIEDPKTGARFVAYRTN